MGEVFIILAVLIINIFFGKIILENSFKCSMCGKYRRYFNRKGVYLHPDNIVNICSDKDCIDRWGDN